MNARERMITALEHKREPDRVPVFVEGMMDKFRQRSDQLYGDQITDDKVVMIGGDWTWAKFYGYGERGRPSSGHQSEMNSSCLLDPACLFLYYGVNNSIQVVPIGF